MILQNSFPILFQNVRMDEVFRVIRQHGSPSICVQLPYAMIEEHEYQAIKNHSQSIKRLAQRGGLSTQEALAVLEDRPWKNMGYGEANAMLLLKVERWEASRSAPVSDAEPVAWRCKDFADGWILDQSECSAREYTKNTGCMIQPLFTVPPNLEEAVNALSDEQVRNIADSKDVASCRTRLRIALGLTTDT